MTRMRAYIAAPGADAPVLEERPVPQPGAAQILVRVRAVALNNGDLSPVDEPQVPGFEFAGEVADVGSSVDPQLIGRRVMGIGEGAFADYAVAHHTHVVPVPDGLDPIAAAGLPTALATEYGALRRAGLTPDDTVLITAATSGIAMHAVRVARALGAGTVIGTTRRASRRALAERAGADHVVVTDDEDLAESVRRLTDGRGADVVLDHVGGPLLDHAIQAARVGGSVVSVGRLGARTAEIDLFGLARRQVRLQSVSFGLNPPTVLGDLFTGVAADLLPAVEEGSLAPVLDGDWSFEQLPAAVHRLREGRAEGKITLAVA